MSPDAIIQALVFLIVGILGWLARTNMQRQDNIEKELDTKITEQQTRQILADKLEPLKEGLDDVKDKLDSLYNLLLK